MSVSDWTANFIAGLIITTVLGWVIIGAVAYTGHHIAYWIAFCIAAAFAFLGFFIFDTDWID